MKKGSKVLIPWSGGMDSTYLVNYAIDKGCIVHTAYFEILNNKDKTPHEIEARDNMKRFFMNKAESKRTTFIDHGRVASFNMPDIAEYGSRTRPVGNFSQTPLWIMAAAYMADQYDYVAMGFVMGDKTVSWAKEYAAMFESYKNIKQDVVDKSRVKLVFPLMKTPKDIIWQGLPAELKNNLWICENPHKNKDGTHRECGRCEPCIKHPGHEDMYVWVSKSTGPVRFRIKRTTWEKRRIEIVKEVREASRLNTAKT